MINEIEIESFLSEVFENACDGEITIFELFEEAFLSSKDNDNSDVDVRTFETAGVLTSNRGLVVRIGDSEFQITIVQSR